MKTNEITFDSLPQAVAYLVDEVAAIKLLVENRQISPPAKRVPIGIDDACQIIGKAKPTVYSLVRKRFYVKSPQLRYASDSISYKSVA